MGSLKPERGSGAGLPWHELHSRPSSPQLPWIPGKEDDNRNFRGGIDAGAVSQGPGFGVQLPLRIQVQILTPPLTGSRESEASYSTSISLCLLICKEGSWWSWPQDCRKQVQGKGEGNKALRVQNWRRRSWSGSRKSQLCICTVLRVAFNFHSIYGHLIVHSILLWSFLCGISCLFFPLFY